MLTLSDYMQLFALITFAAFITYTFSEVQQAIASWLDE